MCQSGSAALQPAVDGCAADCGGDGALHSSHATRNKTDKEPLKGAKNAQAEVEAETVSSKMWHTAQPWPACMPAGLFPCVVAACQTLGGIVEECGRWGKGCKGKWEAHRRREGLVRGFAQVRTELGSNIVLLFFCFRAQTAGLGTDADCPR